MSTFKALVVDKNDQGEVTKEVRTLEESDLPEGDVTIDVHYSSCLLYTSDAADE